MFLVYPEKKQKESVVLHISIAHNRSAAKITLEAVLFHLGRQIACPPTIQINSGNTNYMGLGSVSSKPLDFLR